MIITTQELQTNYRTQVDYAAQTVARDYESENQVTREQAVRDGESMKDMTITEEKLLELAKRHRAWLITHGER